MKLDPNQVIDEILGGTRKASKIFGVSDAAISQWRTDGIPQAREMYIRVVYRQQIKQLEAQQNDNNPAT